MENQELIEQLKSFVTRASRESSDWSRGERVQNWWSGKVDAYQHILCVLDPEHFGDTQATQAFLDEAWSIPGELLDEEDEDSYPIWDESDDVIGAPDSFDIPDESGF